MALFSDLSFLGNLGSGEGLKSRGYRQGEAAG